MIEHNPFLFILAKRIQEEVGLDTNQGILMYEFLSVNIRRRCLENDPPTRDEIREMVLKSIPETEKPDVFKVPRVDDFFPSKNMPDPFGHEIRHTRKFIDEVLVPLNKYYEMPIMAGRGPRHFKTSVPVYEIGINEIDSRDIIELIKTRRISELFVGIYGMSKIGLVFMTLPFHVLNSEVSFILLEKGISSTNDFTISIR